MSNTIVKLIYHALFQPHFLYDLQVWGQNLSRSSRVSRLQRIEVRIIKFSDSKASSQPMFIRTSTLSIHRFVFKLNVMLAHEILNRISPLSVQQSLILEYLPPTYVTGGNQKKMLNRPYVKTTKHGIYSVRYQTVVHWNTLQRQFKTLT